MNSSTIIRLKNVSKSFRLLPPKPTLVEQLTGSLKPVANQVINDLNLAIPKGQILGIYGANGTGKTTLLKIIAGIITPDTGQVKVQGKIATLIDLTAGFQMELSGWDNIRLQLVLQSSEVSGFKTMAAKIINIAQLEKFIRQPLYTYSSGMLLRLAFAIATTVNADIYLIDEYVSVGDARFRRQCDRILNRLKKQGKTIVAASHDLGWLLHFTDNILLLTPGQTQVSPPIPPDYFHFFERALKHQPTTIIAVSDSMMPGIKPGDHLRLTTKPFSSVKCGDIVAFIFPNYPQPIVHRVVGIGTIPTRSLLTKGDANEFVDPWQVTAANYLGVIDLP